VIRPPRLRPGDRIALVAPASPFDREELDRGVAELEALGFRPSYDSHLVFARDGYLAGAPDMRVRDLHQAWAAADVRAVIAIRGGYGSAQLLPLLDGRLLRDANKIFIGYSDISALLWFHLQHGMVCFHGPMIDRRLARGEAGYDRRSLLGAVCEPGPLGELAPDGLETLWPGEASGVLIGGTLTQMVSLLGTPWAVTPPRGSLLFLEDVAERPYRIDRMLTQLRQARALEPVSAIVFGSFPGCEEPGGEPRLRDVLGALTADLGIPVLVGFPSGHTTGPTWTLPLGVRARVVAGSKPALVIEEGAVV
jgi:muramoyltetrapeptide carboxypeptidase